MSDHVRLSPEELGMLLNNEMKDLNDDIDKWMNTTKFNTEKLIGSHKPLVHFFAKTHCSVCGKATHFNDVGQLQFETSQQIIAAKLINQVCGFDRPVEKLNEIQKKYESAETEEEKEKYQAEFKEADTYYHVKFVCQECAVYFQAKFQEVFNDKLLKSGIKAFI